MEFLRNWFQAAILLLTNASWSFPFSRTLYQGPLKVLCSPGLNCYSCPAATVACPIGAVQQLLLSVRMTLDNGQFYIGFYVMGTIGFLGAVFGRMVCGWACPFGFIQELLHKIPSPKFAVPRPLRFLKYGILALTVFILPVVIINDFNMGLPWFCKFICPAGTLEAGLPMLFLQPDLRQIVGTLFWSKFTIMILFLTWSVVSSRPFCQTTCPLGAWYALFKKAKMIRLTLNEVRCTHCKECHPVCPMGVKFDESPDDGECITCFRCMSQACRFGAIGLEIGGLPVQAGDIRAKNKTQD